MVTILVTTAYLSPITGGDWGRSEMTMLARPDFPWTNYAKVSFSVARLDLF